jgi:hypothetical protein
LEVLLEILSPVNRKYTTAANPNITSSSHTREIALYAIVPRSLSIELLTFIETVVIAC